MRATPDIIWSVPAYLPYLQPPLTDAAVTMAEKQIGYRLPSEYLDLLRKQNGGYIRFSLPEMVHDTIAGIGPNFPSLTEFDWDEIQDYVSFPLQGLVPFDGDGHWHLCLDYRRNPTAPAITYADVECDQESHVADSFADYLALLRLTVNEEYVIEGVADVERLKVDLSRQLQASFDPTDTWANGFPQERASLGSDGNPQTLWISPNTVRHGFVRPNHDRYPDLKDVMPDFADRFPGLPPGSYLISATDGVRQLVLDACARCGIQTRPIRDYLTGV